MKLNHKTFSVKTLVFLLAMLLAFLIPVGVLAEATSSAAVSEDLVSDDAEAVDRVLKNGSVIAADILQSNQRQTSYYSLTNGIDLAVSALKPATVSKAMTLSYDFLKSDAITSHYQAYTGASPLIMTIASGFSAEKVSYTLDLTNSALLSASGVEASAWRDGQPVYVYAADMANLKIMAAGGTVQGTPLPQSTTDGVINSGLMVTGQIADGKITFDIPGMFVSIPHQGLLISLNPLEVSTLPGAIAPSDISTQKKSDTSSAASSSPKKTSESATEDTTTKDTVSAPAEATVKAPTAEVVPTPAPTVDTPVTEDKPSTDTPPEDTPVSEDKPAVNVPDVTDPPKTDPPSTEDAPITNTDSPATPS